CPTMTGVRPAVVSTVRQKCLDSSLILRCLALLRCSTVLCALSVRCRRWSPVMMSIRSPLAPVLRRLGLGCGHTVDCARCCRYRITHSYVLIDHPRAYLRRQLDAKKDEDRAALLIQSLSLCGAGNRICTLTNALLLLIRVMV